MRIKSIKGLIKTLIATTIMSMSIVTVAFADSGLYTSKATVDSNNNTIIQYNNGSWFSYNNTTKSYIFKENEGKKVSFSNMSELDDYLRNYKQDKEVPFIKGGITSIGFGKHSDLIYIENLSTDENLEKYATQWLKDNYNLELTIPIFFSSDIDNKIEVNGRFNYKDDKNIEINSKLKGMDLITEKVLIHELTHYALYKKTEEFTDNAQSFINECVKNGANTNDYDIGFLSSHLECTKCNITIK